MTGDCLRRPPAREYGRTELNIGDIDPNSAARTLGMTPDRPDVSWVDCSHEPLGRGCFRLLPNLYDLSSSSSMAVICSGRSGP